MSGGADVPQHLVDTGYSIHIQRIGIYVSATSLVLAK
jgi:hypothetical protein